jgi:hypothetical protein
MTGQPYEAPALTEIGTLHELTLINLKSGPAPDGLTPIIGITGSTGILVN